MTEQEMFERGRVQGIAEAVAKLREIGKDLGNTAAFYDPDGVYARLAAELDLAARKVEVLIKPEPMP
jgi:hypothetical protein